MPAGNPAVEQLLRFTVRPPWWRTSWALGGFVALAKLVLWGAADTYRARQRRHRARQRDQHEREVATEASLAKTRFLATLGHEVRTPMTGVLGMSELLLGTALDPRQRGYTESIRGAGEHLLRLMDDALDLARIESGKLQLSDEAFAVRPLVAGVVALMAPLARRRGLEFRVELAADLPDGLRGDASRVRQILLNLLGNAIKFTERGEVSLRVRIDGEPRASAGAVSRRSAPADRVRGEQVHGDLEPVEHAHAGQAPGAGVRRDGILLEIGDTGPGLNAEQQARLFRRFEQAEGARTAARYGGSGLGLAICQELAAAMGGSIAVDSTPGLGTRFSVSLPLPVAEPPSPLPRACGSGLKGPRRLALLLVEDDPTVAEVIVGLLRAQGHDVTHAAQGLAALIEVATARFDVAVLDLDLLGMDDFALARQLRAQGFVAPLIALTARADADAEPLSILAGFDRFIRKPVTGTMLAGLLEACFEAQASVELRSPADLLAGTAIGPGCCP